MKSLPTDFFINIFLLLLGVLLIVLASQYPAMARHFPQLVLAMIIIVTLLDIVKQIWMRIHGKVTEGNQQEGSGVDTAWKRIIYMIFLMFAFFALLMLFGLPLGVFLFVFFSAWTLGYKRVKVLVVSSLGFTAFVYLIFVVIMKSLVPEGMIFRLLGG